MIPFVVKCYVLILFIGVAKVVAEDFNITIPLNKTTLVYDKQLYGDFVMLNRSSILKVQFSDVGKHLSFIIFQVHSYLNNVTLYTNYTTKVTGTNIGLHTEDMGTEHFFIQNTHANVVTKLYIAVHGYSEHDPIPGGCNMEFSEVSVNPFLKITYNKDYVYVDAAPARNKLDTLCVLPMGTKLSFYVMYLPPQNFGEDVYFEAVHEMMNLKSLKMKSYMPQSMQTIWNNRRMVMSYPGTGAVYVAVANAVNLTTGHLYESRYSVYVPAVSYACSPPDDDCELLGDWLSELLCASLLFVGFFICFFGHRFFKTHTFVIGLLDGFCVWYIFVSLITDALEVTGILAISLLFGTFTGVIRLLLWWFYGLPVLTIIMSSFNVGILTAALIIYSIPDTWAFVIYLNVDITLWAFFVIITTLVTILLIIFNKLSMFICYGVVGAYITILPIDYYQGSNLKYILIYIYKRITVTHFYKALKMTTYQWKDGLLLTLWLCLAVAGGTYQWRQNVGRPPFPPPPRSVRAREETPATVTGGPAAERRLSERTPLLS